MATTKRFKTIGSIVFIVTLLVALLVVMDKVEAAPQTALDGHWIGTTSQGYPIEFDVSGGGMIVTTFKIAFYLYASGSNCYGYQTSAQFDGPIVVSNNQFSYYPINTTLVGQFQSATTASGNFSTGYSSYYCNFYTGSLAWWAHLAVPPGSFGKISPQNGATNQSLAPMLSWQNASGATSYEYCIGTSSGTCNVVNWTSTGTNTNALPSNLNGGTTYYWQVRSRNSDGTTDADVGTWWVFTTLPCYSLISGVNPSSSGSIVVSPMPNCNGSTQYSSGTDVSLLANPATGYVFSGWSGDISGSQNPVTVTMNANKNVTANFSTAASMTWARTYGGSALDYALAIVPTNDGGVVVAGRTASFGAGDVDVWIFRLNAQGNIVWQKTYGGSGNDSASSIASTSDGGYIVGGSTSSFGAGSTDAWVFKMDASGAIQWQKTYGGLGNEDDTHVIQTSDGGYFVATTTQSLGVGGSDVLLMKLNGAGNLVWSQTWGNSDRDDNSSVTQTSDGGYVITGDTVTATGWYAWLLKLDGAGNTQWQKTYTTPSGISSLLPTSDGGYIGVGNFLDRSWDGWVLKFNAQGDIQWQKTYGGSLVEYFNSITAMGDGNYMISGYTSSFSAGEWDPWVLEVNGSGNILWQKVYGGSADGVAYPIARASDGTYFVAGFTNTFGAGDYDGWILKLDDHGNIAGSCATVASSTGTAQDSGAVVTGVTSIKGTASPVISNSSATPSDSNAQVKAQCGPLPPSPDDFVITVKTDNPGSSSNTQFTIPTIGSGYNYNVDCTNDGVNEATVLSGNYTCNYATAGTYTIRIRDNTGTKTGFPRIYFNNGGDKQKLLTIEQWGTGKWTSMAGAFNGCVNLAGQPSDSPDLTNVTDMNWMFSGASVFNADISSWNTAKVTDMSGMFSGASAFNQNISNWSIANVTKMNSMFQDAQSFNQNIGSWSTANVTTMWAMFYGANAFNQNIGSWNTAKVTDMSVMFWNATAFNQDIGSWNTANVQRMDWMFLNASAFNGNIGSWNTANVTNMSRMFDHAIAFNQNIGSWNTVKVTDMSDMFAYANTFNQNIGNWNTANVTNMSYMFWNATAFNQDISSWNTAKVASMNCMLCGASAFNQNIGSWNVGALTDATNMFTAVTLSTANYDALLNGWGTKTLHNNVSFDGGNSKYCAGEAARNNMITTYGWNITDGGKLCTTTTLTSTPTASVFGQTVTFTATVTSTQGIPTGTVNFFDDATQIGSTALNENGKAILPISSLSVGTHPTITAHYSGDVNNPGSTSNNYSQTVNRATTTISVTSTPNPSIFGQAVTFTATVSVTAPGAGAPTGMVTFFDGVTNLGSRSVNGSGQATLSISTLAVGTHSTITAQYGGDVNFTGSTSDNYSHTVNKVDTTTSLTSSPNPATYGQAITFTATVTETVSGISVASGMIAFKEGGTDLTGCTAQALDGSGQATCVTTSLTAGLHNITAVYSGDASRNPSTSNTINQTVNQPPTITTFSPTSGIVGSMVMITGTHFTGATVVQFNGTSASFEVISATSISATVPGVATTGPISVTTPGGIATSASIFSVIAPILYAKPSATGLGSCGSWANACTLWSALAMAVNGNEIWVMQGTHKPSATGDRAATFQLKSGVGVYGGFLGTETSRQQRNYTVNITLLSGDLSGNDNANVRSTEPTRAENAYHVVMGSGTNSAAVLDGFTISGGNANTNSCLGTGCGGGMYNDAGSPIVRNVIFSANSAVNAGGGMVNWNNSHVTLLNVTFSRNSSGYVGGGLSNDYGSLPTLTNVTFNENSAINGGGMYIGSSSPTLTNVTFSRNSAGYGGGLYSVAHSDALLTNVTFNLNTAMGLGGAMYNGSNSNPTIRNAIFWDDSVNGIGAEIYSEASSTILTNTIVQGGCPSNSICTNMITADPLLGTLDNYGGGTQLLPLLPGSSAIDAGDSRYCPAQDQRDLNRVGICDIGAFESQGFTLTILGGNDQTTSINASFALPLQVGVMSNNVLEPVNGGRVLFTAPASGASVITATQLITIANAVAAVNEIANNIIGPYQVGAETSGANALSFALTNSAKANTVTRLSSLPAHPVFGQIITFTVAVTSTQGIPTGTVMFFDGAVNLGSGVLNAGVATFSTASLGVGTHANLTVQYNGDASHAGSTSLPYSLIVEKADMTAQVTSSPQISVWGQPVTFTATLSVVTPGVGTPTGNVIFYDGASIIGQSSVKASGTAVLTLSTLSVGLHQVTVEYTGDTNFNGATSSVYVQTVTRAPYKLFMPMLMR